MKNNEKFVSDNGHGNCQECAKYANTNGKLHGHRCNYNDAVNDQDFFYTDDCSIGTVVPSNQSFMNPPTAPVPTIIANGSPCADRDYPDDAVDPIDTEIGIETIYKRNVNDGFQVDNGYIVPSTNRNRSWVGAFIPGVIIDGNVRYRDGQLCSIVNTVDKGFRFAGVDENGRTIDIGPVDAACVIVGNIKRPDGIYIPMHNYADALMGLEIASKIIEHASPNPSLDTNHHDDEYEDYDINDLRW